MSGVEKINNILNKHKQDHLLKFYNDLNDDERVNFIKHISTIEYEETNKLFKKAMDSLNSEIKKLDHYMKPIPQNQIESEETTDKDQLEKYFSRGLEKISKNQVGVLLMAGGQGTRLGVSYPKGMYSVGLPSKKTLFQIQAERIIRLQNLAKERFGNDCVITWYIMTSGPTKEPTETFFIEHNYFNLNKDNVVIFEQGLLPCFNFDGKIILEDKNKIALAPDGNGGIYRALYNSKILDDMKTRGILYVHAHSVDNILIKVADPTFIGYCSYKGADCGAKVVQKAGPNEAVGVVCLVDNEFQVVEYSEITEETASREDDKGTLVFNAGNICNHFFTTEFLNRVAFEDLKLHVAKKKIPFINDNGVKVKPTEANGIKIEKFVFDVFKYSKNFVTWEVPRETEFSALKNSDDAKKDCPSTAKHDLLKLHNRYINDNGGTVEGDEVEISPLLSYSGENLELVNGKTYSSPFILKGNDEK